MKPDNKSLNYILKSIPNYKIIIVIFIIIGVFLRFYDINWGAPYYFNPDERNIASSINQLSFPFRMNPHFFAYGSLPIYTIYFLGVILNFIQNIFFHSPTQNQILYLSFEKSIIIGRVISASLSVILLLIIYKTAVILKGKSTGLIAIILSSISTGLIQYSHFGTFEIWLTLLSTLFFYFLLKYINHKNNKYFFLSILTLGLLVSVKISSLALIVIPCIALIITTKNKYGFINVLKNVFLESILIIIIVFACFVIFSPYSIIDYQSFRSSILYESSVAMGTLHVFYTDGFYNTVPVIFQFLKVYPFLINPILTLLFLPTMIFFIYETITKKDSNKILLLIFFFVLFFSQAFLFVKWTRYMLPTLPFIYLIISTELSNFIPVFSNKKKFILLIKYLVLGIILISSIVNCISFFITVYAQKDTRVLAAEFAKNNIPYNAKILSEVYDLGIVPFNSTLNNIALFNFYDLDNGNNLNENGLYSNLNNYKYIILPSQRILRSRLLNPNIFPRGYKFYNNLINEKSGYRIIYSTPCDILCKITYINNPIWGLEETAYVFDRPSIYIFKKM